MSEDPAKLALRVSHFAEIHGVSSRTVRRWIGEGKVVAVKTPGGQQWRVIFVKISGQPVPTADNPT